MIETVDKMYDNFGVMWGSYVILLLVLLLILYKTIVYIPQLIKEHWTQIKEEREAFSSSLKEITNKFSNNMDNINDTNKTFFNKIEEDSIKSYAKLEEIHSDIKFLKSNK